MSLLEPYLPLDQHTTYQYSLEITKTVRR